METKKLFQEIKKHYTPLIEANLENYQIVDWADSLSQQKRFEIALKIPDFKNKKIIDIGCGCGDFIKFLEQKNNLPKSYTGIDIIEKMILRAQKQNPKFSFFHGNVFTKNPQKFSYDIVFSSGIFNLKNDDNMKFVQLFLEKIQHLTHEKTTIICNFLHNRSTKKYPQCFYFDPQKIIHLFKKYYKEIELIDDYLINDFTIMAKNN